MSNTTYRVIGVNSLGIYYSHLVGAASPRIAAESVKAADPRLIRITSIKPVFLD